MIERTEPCFAGQRALSAAELNEWAAFLKALKSGLENAAGLHCHVSADQVSLAAAYVEGRLQEPHDLGYAGEHAEAARSDDYASGVDGEDVLWDRRDPPADTAGVTVRQALGVAYYHTGDKKLYQYVADFHYDSNGCLVKISDETRTEIDAAESCS